MGITVLHIENCPNVALVRRRLTEALDRSVSRRRLASGWSWTTTTRRR